MQKILVVDDDPTIREVLIEIITVYGYQALSAESARDAIGLLAKEKVDLIMLDIQMPDISGDQFLDFIRKKGFKTPVVIVSAHVDRDMARQLGAAGASGMITKPFEVDRVIDAMNKALGVAM